MCPSGQMSPPHFTGQESPMTCLRTAWLCPRVLVPLITLRHAGTFLCLCETCECYQPVPHDQSSSLKPCGNETGCLRTVISCCGDLSRRWCEAWPHSVWFVLLSGLLLQMELWTDPLCVSGSPRRGRGLETRDRVKIKQPFLVQ